MKNAKNDKTWLKRERLLTTKRLRFARLIVALSLTTSGSVFFADKAYSQTPPVGYSSVYLSDAPIARANLNPGGNVGRGNSSYGASVYSGEQATINAPIARANLNPNANVGRGSSSYGASVYSGAQGTSAVPTARRANADSNVAVGQRFPKSGAQDASVVPTARANSGANASIGNVPPVRIASAYSNAQGKVVDDSRGIADAKRRAFSVPMTIPRSTPKVSHEISDAKRRAFSVPMTIPRSTPKVSRVASVPSAAPKSSVDAETRPVVQNEVVPSSDAQDAPKQLQEAAASLQGVPNVKKLETLEAATQIALEESRTQRALALQKGAARSTVDAARSLANPKITNATAYVGLANRPTLETNVDLSGALGGLGGSVPGLADALSGIPTQFKTESILADKEFATSVTALTIPVYLGGRVQALTRAAEATTAAIEAGEDVDEQRVKAEVSEAYFLVLRTRKLHEVALEGIQTTQAHLDDATRMLNAGLVTRNVVLAAQVANAEAKQLELRVANAQNLAESTYNRVLWRPLDAPVEIADVELGAPLGELETLTSQAVRTRAELRVLQNESRAMQEQENVARADVLPQVAIVGAYSYQENEALKDNSNGAALVGMVWTPFDGGTSRARRESARQSAMAITRAREEAESGVRLQVRQAWLAEQEARSRVEVARVAVEQAEENLRVVTRGFQEGLMNHTEALDASAMRTAAKSNFANAQYDAILATQRLRCAVGTL